MLTRFCELDNQFACWILIIDLNDIIDICSPDNSAIERLASSLVSSCKITWLGERCKAIPRRPNLPGVPKGADSINVFIKYANDVTFVTSRGFQKRCSSVLLVENICFGHHICSIWIPRETDSIHSKVKDSDDVVVIWSHGMSKAISRVFLHRIYKDFRLFSSSGIIVSYGKRKTWN